MHQPQHQPLRVLIPTHLDDIHALAVALALRRKGHEAVLWHGADFPTRQTASIEITTEGEVHCTLDGPDLALDGRPFDVVWYRRPTMPRIPQGFSDVPAGDVQIARRESHAFYNALWQLVAPDAFWVNPLGSRFRSNSKPTQLRAARAAGFSIPPTLFSNDPRAIRRFVAAHEGHVIFKPFAPTQWRLDDGVAMLFTSEVTLDDLPDDDVLQLCPGIFQRRIEKAHELRVTAMGHHSVVARLQSQKEATAQADWRASFAKLPVEPGEIPPAVERCCQELMRRLGIVFGCLDLIVTPEGEHYFLEVNEMGQFLWIDEMEPRLETLDPFCEFLISRRADFAGHPSSNAVRFCDVSAEALARMEADRALHVDRPDSELAPDHDHPHQHSHSHHHTHHAHPHDTPQTHSSAPEARPE